MKNKAAQSLARRRNKKYGKKWLKANAEKMVAARKSKTDLSGTQPHD
jgi:hypothetical protein